MHNAGTASEITSKEISVPAGDQSTFGRFTLHALSELKPHPKNPRRHTGAQLQALAKSIASFGFNAPILVDKNNRIVAGHGRYEAAKLLGNDKVPVICLEHLTDAQARAYMLADNKLTDRSHWDDTKLAEHLKELSELVLDFEIEATGFEPPEIDFRIQSLDLDDTSSRADDFRVAAGPPVSILGDLWHLGNHRLYCGSAIDAATYESLFKSEKAAAVFTDPPYNVKIDGNVCGSGAIKHREFAMASGEMNEDEFSDFLTSFLRHSCAHSLPGAIVYACMDWRHMSEMLAGGRGSGCELLNVCVWAKSNGGMGSFYRSRHEFVFVFRNGGGSHTNNVQLGRFGRNRTNVWNYPGVSSFKADLELHPTVKPIAMIADAILDSTKRDDVILDPFVGSGTSILAAERTGRRCHAIEIDPIYVDTAIGRWQDLTGNEAYHENEKPFATIKAERRQAQ